MSFIGVIVGIYGPGLLEFMARACCGLARVCCL
jgi:hypothetical protein